MIANLKKKNFWKNKKVFVTGHTGFKGGWLSLVLKFLGATVIGYSLKPLNKKNFFNEVRLSKYINKSIIGDIRDKKKLFKEIKKSKATIVFHLAAQALVRESYRKPTETIETNIMGTLNVLDCIKKIKSIKSSVIITSDKVYDVKKNKVFKETDLLGGVDPYSASKVCCEHIFKAYINSFFEKNRRGTIATARAGNVIGGGDYSKDRLIPDIIRSVQSRNKILLRNPKHVRPWQHVLDPVTGYINLAEKLYKKINKDNLNWNFGPDLPNCKPVDYIARKFSLATKSKIIVIKEKEKLYKKETTLLRLDNRKVKKLLNWYPKWSLDYSIKKIFEWHFNSQIKDKQKICLHQIEEYFSKN